MARSIHIEGYRHQNPIPVASVAGNILASSVISGADLSTGEMPVSLDEQCANMFAAFRRILDAAGASFADVVKVTVRMEDRSQRDVLNRHWLAAFPDADARPARHTEHESFSDARLVTCDFIAVLGG